MPNPVLKIIRTPTDFRPTLGCSAFYTHVPLSPARDIEPGMRKARARIFDDRGLVSADDVSVASIYLDGISEPLQELQSLGFMLACLSTGASIGFQAGDAHRSIGMRVAHYLLVPPSAHFQCRLDPGEPKRVHSFEPACGDAEKELGLSLTQESASLVVWAFWPAVYGSFDGDVPWCPACCQSQPPRSEQLLATLGRPIRQILFAANGPKPEIVVSDALANDIRVVKDEEFCLSYNAEIHIDTGLLWSDLVAWWAGSDGVAQQDDAERTLYKRLRASLGSEVEHVLFKNYFKLLREAYGPRLPALLPQVYLHYDPYTLRERAGVKRLPRERMDFLILLPFRKYVVLEVDGQQHYASALDVLLRLGTRKWFPPTGSFV